jgi:hypothetical protein
MPPLSSLLWAVGTSILFGTSTSRNDAQWEEERRVDSESFDLAAIEVRRHPMSLSQLIPELKSEREIVLAAVKKCGFALEDGDVKFRHDFEIVLAAVQSRGHALEYAAPALQADFRIVLAAVRQNYKARAYAAEELKNHPIIVEAADKQIRARRARLTGQA